MSFDDYYLKELKPSEICDAERLLNSLGLILEEGVDVTLGLFDQNKLIGTGSVEENVLKCIAVDPDYQEGGLTTRIVNKLIAIEEERGFRHLFLFTRPDNISYFSGLGFTLLERSDKLYALLEFGPHGLKSYLEEIREVYNGGDNGGIVMNCNPFTLGHLYLIEQAASQVDHLYIFVVREDRSLFPYNVRFDLIEKGCAHLDNVHVISGGEYIISSSTFPNYFVRNEEDLTIVREQTVLDIRIFAHHIAPALDIWTRFVGTEPYCKTTSAYNDAMKSVLPEFGIKLVEIERKEAGDMYISASTVREMIREDDWEGIKDLVPETTYSFLRSDDAKSIIENIKRSDSRH